MESKICNKAILVGLYISMWTARKLDRKVTSQTTAEHKAVKDAGRFHKRLLPGAQPLKDLTRIAQDFRLQNYRMTLPWSDDGLRLLPTDMYWDYISMTKKMRAEWESAMEDFLREYPELCLNAQSKLGDMYNLEEYPPLERIRKKFNLEIAFYPVPAQGDFRVSLPEDQVKQIEAETESRVTAAAETALKDAWRRLSEQVSKMHERLANPENIFRDSLVENARELCGLLKRLNFADDPDLENMRKAVELQLAAYDPQSLRDDKRLRSDVAAKAKSILDAMSPFVA